MKSERPPEEPGVYEAMSTTRAVRRLRTDPIPDEVLQRVLQAATWAPSGGNVQPWRIVVVRDEEKKRALQALYIGPWQAYVGSHRRGLEGAPEAVRARQERMLAAADHLAEHLHEAPALILFCFNPSLLAITDAALDRPSVVGGGSLYPAVQNLLLACRAEGLGCTLTTLLCQAEPEVQKLLELPDPWATYACVPIGWPASRGHGPIRRNAVEKMVYLDGWGRPLTDG